MPFIILSVLVQVAFVLHIVKTGRNTTWIWIVVMLPAAGSIAYFLLEVLPELMGSRTGRQASRKVQSVVNPNKGINDAARQYSMSDTVENSMRLAEECLNKGLYDDAKSLYQKSLKGQFSEEPELLLGLAKACFGLNEYEEVKNLLDQLKTANPDYSNQDAHLLYARALEGMGEVSAAFHEYETLHGYFTGPEASYYFGVFLKNQNQPDKAKEIFKEILAKADMSSRSYRDFHKDILRLVKTELVG